ncbi:MAG TPA: permease, partial [Methylomirabilota bacterium]|nr:permease [Methylomirabilota bacterium]
NNNTAEKSKIFLIIDAVAPVLGALSTLLFTVPSHFLLWYLGFFAGFLLYIGVSDILPEAHSKHSSSKLILLTILGTCLIFVITRFT